jgi:hypothetical protein
MKRPFVTDTLTDKDRTPIPLKAAMIGRASAAKAATGVKPVFEYIASLPEPQREIAEHVDVLAATALPDLQRAVKWGMAYYGTGGGWCFSSGAFVGHLKIMFIRGTELSPVPPIIPGGMGKATHGIEPACLTDLDGHPIISWIEQAAAIPFLVRKRN